MESSSLRACPSCGAELPELHGYLTWCDKCNWNVSAPAQELPSGTLGRLYAAAGRRMGDRLARELISADELEPRMTAAKLAAYVIAAFVYVFELGLIAASGFLIAIAPTNPAAIIAVIILLGTAFFMRPRVGKPPETNLIGRSEAPVLHETIDAVAAALETRTVDVVRVDHRFNASFAVLGLRRRRVLTLGLPLVAALEPQERVELIAHELAHGRNGDSTRGLFVGSSLDGLIELFRLLKPEPWEGGQLAWLEPIANAVLWLISRPAYWLLLLQAHLLMRDSQRAEYLADALAASVAGTASAISSHEKTLLHSAFEHVVKELARPGEEGDVFVEIHARLSAVPERERERRRRVARLEESRLDVTHPPTALRIRLLEERPQQEAKVTVDEERSAAIDQELARFKRAFQERLVDEHRDALFKRGQY